MKEKMLVISGPTTSGKSSLAVELAKKFKGEIISADSRQVYKRLDIGSGKITQKEMGSVPHHLLDVASPRKIFTVEQFKKLAEKKIEHIHKQGRLPIICGGTGFYIQAVIDDLSLPQVKPNIVLRKKLQKKSTQELSSLLKKLDPKRHRTIDLHNLRRLIRAIEIADALGYVPPLIQKERFDTLHIALQTNAFELRKKIHTRLLKRLKQGMIGEVLRLHKKGLSWKRLESLGLEYKYVALYLQKKLSKKEMIEKLETEIKKYAKRQITWFRKDKRIKWFPAKDKRKIQKEIKNFLEIEKRLSK